MGHLFGNSGTILQYYGYRLENRGVNLKFKVESIVFYPR